MRIMFMGTPDIASIVLERLVREGHDIISVVTGEDKPRRRGGAMLPTPVKRTATELGIPVLTPSKLTDEDFLSELDRLSPDLIVVVAFGKMLRKRVLDAPPYGCINLHVSLLPKYRGAAPMQRAIMSGDDKTGVTIMYMNEGLDTGDIIATEEFAISESDDFEAIHDRSAELGSVLLSNTVTDIFAERITRTKQDDSLATYAKKVEKEDCKIDFSMNAERLDCIIRGVTPIPGAFAYLNGKMLKINRARPVKGTGACGEVIDLDDKGDGAITVACGEGALRITSVIPEGKGRMSAGDFIRGRKIKLGDILN